MGPAPSQMASPAPPPLKEAVGGLDRGPFVALLGKPIGESARLQNDPLNHVPREDLVAQHIVDALRLVSTETGGGPLVEYPGTFPGRVVSFVGMHMHLPLKCGVESTVLKSQASSEEADGEMTRLCLKIETTEAFNKAAGAHDRLLNLHVIGTSALQLLVSIASLLILVESC